MTLSEPSLPRFYYFANALLRTVGFRALRVTITTSGLENVPAEGPLIVVFNHLSFADPAFLVAFIPRDIIMMSKIENFQGNPLVAWVTRNYGAFPIRRGEADIGALRHALHLLASGSALLVAPEGTRSQTRQLREPQEGIAFLAARSRAWILPVGMTGTEDLEANLKRWRPTHIHLSVGRPFRFIETEFRPDRGVLREMSVAVMERIAAQLPLPYRGRFTGFTESQRWFSDEPALLLPEE